MQWVQTGRGNNLVKITFTLPTYSLFPVGGFKIVYEYANRLQERGHQVTLVHPRHLRPQTSLHQRIEVVTWKARNRILDERLVPWFPLHPDVRVLLTTDLRAQLVPDGDAVFATAWHTAPWVNEYGAEKGRKFYLIQGYEIWDGPKEEVDATWRMPLHKIVIARWLWNIGARFGQEEHMTHIPNAIDLKQFRLLSSIDARPPHRIGMLYHESEWKGSPDGIAALSYVRQVVPDVDVVLFGASPRSDRIPEWMTYVENPHVDKLVRLYNSLAIFLHPSRNEGWPLPPAEAMACGCALVAARNDGVREYAREGETALLAPIKDPESLAVRLLHLLSDDVLRQRIARAGHEHIRTFSWKRAVDSMEKLLMLERLS